MSSVSVVIPALNEGETIGKVLAAIPRECVAEIVVVDGGSTDDTAAVARAGGARVIHEPRRGYGRACAAGALAANGDIIVFLDGDGADDPAQLPDLLTPIHSGSADLVLGSRMTGKMEPGAMPWHQEWGNRVAARLITRLYGIPLTDLSPFRAIKCDVLLALNMAEMTYGWPTEMIVKTARRGYRIEEIPVRYRPRLSGRSKISGTIRGSIMAAYHILRTIFCCARGELNPDE